MLDKLRDEIIAYLAQHDVCVLSTVGTEGAWATLVRCHSRGLNVDCLLPRWADAAYHLEQDPRVLLVIHTGGHDMRWLEVRGAAHLVEQPDWTRLLPGAPPAFHPAERYQVVRVSPRRIDLFDEGQGWGVRETLEM